MVLGKTQLPTNSHGGPAPVAAAVTAEERRGFVDEMRAVAMKLHTKEQAKEGEKEVEGPEEMSPAKWEPSVEGYLKFLVDSKVVFDTMERIVDEAPVAYCEFLLSLILFLAKFLSLIAGFY